MTQVDRATTAMLAPTTDERTGGVRTSRVVFVRVVLFAITALAGFCYAWGIAHAPLEPFYEAAVHSMATSWHNFFFGSFDPAGTVTIDKLPGAFWIQALFVRIFGFHPWAIVLPQVIEGMLTVLVLYRAVNRLMGTGAALIAALVLAISPATVALNRGNIGDTAMILFLVLAADAVSAAIVTGQQRKWVYAGIWVGLAFQAKMIEAWLVVPAFALAYLLGGTGSVRRKLRQLLVGGLVALVVSLAWMTVVTLVPSSDRPYVDGSTTDSVYQQVFVYNGFGRVGEQTPDQSLASKGVIPKSILGAPAGWNRLLHGDFGREAGWLLPASIAIGIGGLFTRRRSYFVLWAGWLGTLVIVFSVSEQINSGYTAALSPPVAAIVGAGALMLWESRTRLRSAQQRNALTAGAVVVSAGTIAYGIWLLRTPDASSPDWVWVLALTAGVVAIALFVLAALTPKRAGVLLAALGAGLISILAIPASGSGLFVENQRSSADSPFETAAAAHTWESLQVTAPKGAAAAVPTFEALQQHAPYMMAVYTSAVASVFANAADGREVFPIGGFTGTSPAPTIAQLRQDVREGKFHFVLALDTHDSRIQWIAAHCRGVGSGAYLCMPGDAGPDP
jgi:4-amino-4-deoxy-L-arabinose transferase-like glycosyltransferase